MKQNNDKRVTGNFLYIKLPGMITSKTVVSVSNKSFSLFLLHFLQNFIFSKFLYCTIIALIILPWYIPLIDFHFNNLTIQYVKI